MNKHFQDYLREHQDVPLVGMQQGLLLRAGVYTPAGMLVEEVIQPGHSYVIGWATIMNYKFSDGSQSTTATDVTGSSRTLSINTRFIKCDGGAGIDTKGIVVGTGSTAVAMTDTKLVTQTAHGTSADQLSHGLTTFYPVDTVGANPRYTNIARGFQNNSGAAITINEAGLYGNHTHSGGDANFCLCRDLITFTVPIGYLAIVQYQMVFNLT